MKKIYPSIFILLCLFSVKLIAQCTTPAAAPYYEGFNGISLTNELPSCWAASNPSVTCLTFTTGSFSGNKGAGFYYLPSGNNYFYSRALQLNAGITYSVGCWYKVNSNSTIVWTDLSILIGTSQISTGMVSVATTTNLSNTVYTSLTGTFSVPTSGVYYMAIKGTSNGASGSQYLYWDDFIITIPCTPAYNTPTINVVGSSTAICSGQSNFTATASGADTYTWNTGSTAPTTTDMPFSSMNYVVTGTSTLTGCTKTASLAIIVYTVPNIFVVASSPSVCSGSSVTINAIGGATYTWNTGQQSASITATLTSPLTYSVSSAAANGCIGSNALSIGAYPPTVITVSSSASGTLCSGEEATLGASGAVSYQWISSLQTLSGSSITFTPQATTAFTVVSIDANGCTGNTSYILDVNTCTGLNKTIASSSEIKIYPNPGNGTYTLESGNSEIKSIVITDLTGKIIFSGSSSNEKISIDLSNFSNGIYSVKISSGIAIDHVKIVKQ